MSRTTVLYHGVWPRVARSLAAVLLLGGIGVGPAVHLATEAVAEAWSTCETGHEPGSPDQLPDTHHDCPICITLASVATAMLPAMPSARLADAHVLAAPGPTMGDGPEASLSRARAPPIA